jgi:hypothetical protein
MRVVRNDYGTLRFAHAVLEQYGSEYRSVEVHAVPIIGRSEDYMYLKNRLEEQAKHGATILNATVVDDFGSKSDSSAIGNGYWSDIAHISGHVVFDEAIPYEEYTPAHLSMSELLPLMGRNKKHHVRNLEKASKAFHDYDGSMDHNNTYGFIIRLLLLYKYSGFNFWWSEFMYPKAYREVAKRTFEVVSSLSEKEEVVHILVDPYAFNPTVKALESMGYSQYHENYRHFIYLP